MANYANLLATIAANIYTNNNNEVTAAGVKIAVDAMVASLGAGYQFMGTAHPSDTPSGYADLRAFWLAGEAGTYTDFGGLVLTDGEIAFLKYDGNWSKDPFPLFLSGAVGAYINPNNGAEIPANSYDITDFIPVKEGEVFVFSGSVGSASIAVAGYDENKNFIGALLPGGADYDEAIVPESSASYIRASARNQNFGPYDGVKIWKYFSRAGNNISPNLIGAVRQGTTDKYGAPYTESYSYYSSRCYLLLNVPDFAPKNIKILAKVPQGFIIRNACFINTREHTTSDWLSGSGWTAPDISISSPSVDIYNGIVFVLAKSDMSQNVTPAEIGDVRLLGEAAYWSIFAQGGQRKTYSVMGDSIGTDNNGDTPQYVITSNDVGHSLSAWVTWFDYNNSRSDSASGTTKTIGGVPITAAMVGTQQNFTPASSDIGKTLGTPRWSYNEQYATEPWWKILARRLGLEFNASASWNGNSYTSHEENDNLRKIGYAWHPLQIARLAKRDADGNRVAPDVIFLCRGTNDATHTPFALLTNFGDGDDGIPAGDAVSGGYGFKEAIAMTISSIQQTYPKAQIFLTTMSPFRRLSDDTFPMDNDIYTMQAYNKAIKEIAEYMGVGVIDFSKCWNFYNCVSEGFVNSSDYTHPLQKGHNAMAQQALNDVKLI